MLNPFKYFMNKRVLFTFLSILLCILDLNAQVNSNIPSELAPIVKDTLSGDQAVITIRKLNNHFNKGLVFNPLDVVNGRLVGVNVSRGGDQR